MRTGLPSLLALLTITALTVFGQYQSESVAPSFVVDYENDRFLLDGQPFRYIAGSIHYFRIHPQYWRDRLKRVRALGFNAIQYYIPWNYHALDENSYDFSGWRNFTEFSQIAREEGLWTILRIGPYICGEWENGGLPWWILNKPIKKMRSYDEVFRQTTSNWYTTLLPIVKKSLRSQGGPILMVQIENEYGSYDACDKNYTSWLRDYAHAALGKDTVLYTTDGNSDGYLRCGAVPGVLPTVDFGPTSQASVNASFEVQRKYFPKGSGPLVNSEFYPGWLVLWGQKDQSLPSQAAIIDTAKYMYSLGASFTFYMIHGGTNFGFWSGAEIEAPCITSYDYSAPITEAGDITENYVAIQNWIKTIPNWPNQPLQVLPNTKKSNYGKIELKKFFLRPNAEVCIKSDKPLSFENLDHPYGFILYEHVLKVGGTNLTVANLKDFGGVFVNGHKVGTFVNHFGKKTVREIVLPKCKAGDRLSIVVENQGRQTFETINDYKGILSDVLLDGQKTLTWENCPIKLPIGNEERGSLREVKKLLVQENGAGSPGVFMGRFNVNEVTDTFIDTSGWGKGVVLVNGHNLGRYWATQGPQMTLFVPAPFLKQGANSVFVLEVEGANDACRGGSCTMTSIDHAIFYFKNNFVFNDYKNMNNIK